MITIMTIMVTGQNVDKPKRRQPKSLTIVCSFIHIRCCGIPPWYTGPKGKLIQDQDMAFPKTDLRHGEPFRVRDPPDPPLHQTLMIHNCTMFYRISWHLNELPHATLYLGLNTHGNVMD